MNKAGWGVLLASLLVLSSCSEKSKEPDRKEAQQEIAQKKGAKETRDVLDVLLIKEETFQVWENKEGDDYVSYSAIIENTGDTTLIIDVDWCELQNKKGETVGTFFSRGVGPEMIEPNGIAYYHDLGILKTTTAPDDLQAELSFEHHEEKNNPDDFVFLEVSDVSIAIPTNEDGDTHFGITGTIDQSEQLPDGEFYSIVAVVRDEDNRLVAVLGSSDAFHEDFGDSTELTISYPDDFVNHPALQSGKSLSAEMMAYFYKGDTDD